MFVSEKSTVAGIVLGLIVLVGVTSGFASLMNKRNAATKGSLSVEAQITENEDILATLRSQIEKSNSRIQDEFVPRSKQWDQIKELSGTITKQSDQISSLKGASTAAAADTARLVSDGRAYRDKYRKQVRQDAIGEKIATLTTRTGKVFENAQISDVSAQGMTIRYEAGLNRLRPADLDSKWSDRFQWDAEETSVAAAVPEPAPTGASNSKPPVPPKKLADVR